MALLDRSSALMTTSAARARDLPRAAVEIIARLSAERGRLRDEVARLRSELRQAPQPEALAQLRAERDALARQLSDAHQKLSQQTTSGAFQRLQGRQVEALGKLAERLERALSGINARSESFARLEQAVARLERSSNAPRSAAPPASAPQPKTQSPSRTTRPMPRSGGGGMLSGLLRANVALRDDEEPARTRAASAVVRPQPAPAPEPASRSASRSAPRARPRRSNGGGGLLGNLLNQNLGMRRRGTSSH